MRQGARGIAALAAIPLLLLGGAGAGAFPDAPLPAHTGGFGEPTCAACHFDGPDGPAGALVVEGVPARYLPGAEYRLVLRLRDARMRRGGYQLSVRFGSGPAEGAQAGTLLPLDGRSAVTAHGGVQYAHHTAAGAQPTEAGLARWEIRWTAPAQADAPIVLHLTGNAADGDDSQFGYRVYAEQAAVAPAQTRRGGR